MAYMREEDARDLKFSKSGMKSSALGAIKNNIQWLPRELLREDSEHFFLESFFSRWLAPSSQSL